MNRSSNVQSPAACEVVVLPILQMKTMRPPEGLTQGHPRRKDLDPGSRVFRPRTWTLLLLLRTHAGEKRNEGWRQGGSVTPANFSSRWDFIHVVTQVLRTQYKCPSWNVLGAYSFWVYKMTNCSLSPLLFPSGLSAKNLYS